MVETNAKAKEVPPLSLIPEDEVSEEYDSTKTASFKLLTAPGAALVAGGAAPTKYSFTMLKVDGTQSIREHITWYKNILKVFAGLNVNDATDQRRMTEELCFGAALTAYSAGVELSMSAAWETRKTIARLGVFRNPAIPAVGAAPAVPEETLAAWQVHIDAAVALEVRGPVTDADLLQGLKAVLVAICPYKVLEKQKSFMRHKM